MRAIPTESSLTAATDARNRWRHCVARLQAALEDATAVTEIQVAVRAEHTARCRYAAAVRDSGQPVPWYLRSDALAPTDRSGAA